MENLRDLDECIDMASECSQLHSSTKQLLLAKIASMPNFKKVKRGYTNEKHPVLRNPALTFLLNDVRANIDTEYSSR